MNLNNYVEKIGKRNKIYVLIDLKREIRENFVFVKKQKTPTLNVQLKQTFSRFLKPFKDCNHMKREIIWKKLNELASLKRQVKILGLQDKIGKEIFLEETEKYLNTLLKQIKMPLKM